jgi:DeoR family transcriptional regulator of aga operon
LHIQITFSSLAEQNEQFKVNSALFYIKIMPGVDMQNSKALQRQEYIRRLLETNGKVSTKELADRLKVSIWTIRRDLTSLECHGILKRYYGGAHPHCSLNETGIAYESDSFRVSTGVNLEAKRCIGLAAAQLVQPGERLAIAGGTTTLEVVKALKLFHFKGEIVTNALDVALELSEEHEIHVICTGGDLQPRYHTLVGKVAEHMLKQHYFDTAIIGITGISHERGFTVNSQVDATGLEIMMEHSIRTILVADHSKFGRICFAPLSPGVPIHSLVTDEFVASEYGDYLQKKNIQVIVANRFQHWISLQGNEQCSR